MFVDKTGTNALNYLLLNLIKETLEEQILRDFNYWNTHDAAGRDHAAETYFYMLNSAGELH